MSKIFQLSSTLTPTSTPPKMGSTGRVGTQQVQSAPNVGKTGSRGQGHVGYEVSHRRQSLIFLEICLKVKGNREYSKRRGLQEQQKQEVEVWKAL